MRIVVALMTAVAVKDFIAMAGVRTRARSAARANSRVASREAFVVQ